MISRILLTGSTGFVGRNLIPYLLRHNFQVHSAERKELNAQIQLDSFDAIIHLAGKAHDVKSVSNPAEYYSVNFELTKTLFEAFLCSNLKTFIFISSVKAAADSFEGILDENYPSNPLTHYGKSKLMAENYIQKQKLPKDKHCYILRPTMIHGPGNKGNLNLLYQLVEKGIPYPLAAFENKRSFLSVENLCFVIERLLKFKIPSGIYNIADDNPLSTNEVVDILGQFVKKKPISWSIPKWIIKLLAKIGDVFCLPLNEDRLNKLTENYVVSNQKLKQALEIELPLTAKQGLETTANSFVNNLKK